MPTSLIPSRSAHEDLATLREFVQQRQKNWQAVQLNFAIFEKQYQSYLRDFPSCRKYSVLKPYDNTSSAGIFRALYDQKPRCLKHIAELRRHANKKLAVCPYCGLPAGKVTLDHYLPRDRRAFPHLSVFSFNLVPACFACQLAKSNLVPEFRLGVLRQRNSSRLKKRVREKRPRQELAIRRSKDQSSLAHQRQPHRLLHPYFDRFLSNVVWRLQPSDELEPLATLRLVPAVRNLTHAALIGYHVRRLGIQERFKTELAHLVRFTVATFRTRKIVTLDGALAEADIQLTASLAKEKTPNGVQSTFFRAVRDQPVLADAIVGLAMRPLPRRTIKSQGVRL